MLEPGGHPTETNWQKTQDGLKEVPLCVKKESEEFLDTRCGDGIWLGGLSSARRNSWRSVYQWLLVMMAMLDLQVQWQCEAIVGEKCAFFSCWRQLMGHCRKDAGLVA